MQSLAVSSTSGTALQVIVALLLAAACASAQERLSSFVLAGGGLRMSAGNAAAHVTLGQSVAGLAAAGNDAAHAGFWYVPAFIVAAGRPPAPPDRPALVAAWPNPATTRLCVQLALAREQSARVELCDALGRVLCTAAEGRYTAGVSMLVLDVGTLPRGCVFLRLRAGATTVARAVLLR